MKGVAHYARRARSRSLGKNRMAGGPKAVAPPSRHVHFKSQPHRRRGPGTPPVQSGLKSSRLKFSDEVP